MSLASTRNLSAQCRLVLTRRGELPTKFYQAAQLEHFLSRISLGLVRTFYHTYLPLLITIYYKATLVEGGNEASLTYDPPFKPSNGVGYSCTIDGASAVCVGVFGTETETLTENAAPITVQIDPAATPTTTDAGGSTGGSTAAGGISSPQTGSSTSGNPSETTDTNSNTANRNRTDILFAIWGVLLTTFSVGVYF